MGGELGEWTIRLDIIGRLDEKLECKRARLWCESTSRTAPLGRRLLAPRTPLGNDWLFQMTRGSARNDELGSARNEEAAGPDESIVAIDFRGFVERLVEW
jgi:hypothetical protein